MNRNKTAVAVTLIAAVVSVAFLTTKENHIRLAFAVPDDTFRCKAPSDKFGIVHNTLAVDNGL